KKILENRYVQIALVICFVILFYFFVLHIGDFINLIGGLLSILSPLIIGLVLAYIMHPIVNMFENRVLKKVKNKTTRRNLSITITLAIIVGIIVTLISIIIPELLNSIKSIIVHLPSYLNDLENIIRNWISDSAIERQVMDNYDTILSAVTNGLNDIALPAVNTAINNLGSGLLAVAKGILNWLIGFVFAVYILANTNNFGAGTKKVLYSLFDSRAVNEFIVEVKHINKIFVNFMIGKVTDSSIILLLTFIFLLVCGFPYPLLIAVIIGLTDLIPYFGPYIGTVPSAILICFVDPVKALIFVVFIIVLQQIDANLITPRIQSTATGLPSFWVLFAITLFGGLFGIPGLLVGVPVFTVIYEIVRDLIDKRLAKKNMPIDKEYYEKHDSIEKKTIKAKVPKTT
ncbi:MAG: AI-2E family transporter, partial [Bacilli bacterium]|nr:AI-2E family transporter [Bacilli bacterium]